MSFARDEKSRELCQLLGFPALPDNVIVTEESKRLFQEATGIIPETPERGQGFATVAWEDINTETNEPVLYIDLVPAFNKEDKRPRQNKDGKPYIIYDPEKKYTAEEWSRMAVESPENLGQNSGLIHQHAIEVLKRSGRMPKHIQKKNMFGLGVFKGNEIAGDLLAQFRFNSANINPESVRYNEEMICANYYCEPDKNVHLLSADIVRATANDYRIKRALPKFIAIDLILPALFEQLPCETKHIERTCKMDEISELNPEEKWWEKNKNNPIEKNIKLMDTLFTAIRINDKPENQLVENILRFVTSNIRQGANASIINKRFSSFTYYQETALTLAIKKGFRGIVSQLLQAGASVHIRNGDGYTPLELAIKANRSDLVKEILPFYKTAEGKEQACNTLMSISSLDMINGLIKDNMMVLSKKNYTFLLNRAVKEGYIDIFNQLNEYAEEHNLILEKEKEPGFADFEAGITNRVLKGGKEIHSILKLFDESKASSLVTVKQGNMIVKVLNKVITDNKSLLKNAILNGDTELLRRLILIGINQWLTQDFKELLYTAISVEDPEARVEIFKLLLSQRDHLSFWGERREEFIDLIKTNPKNAYFLVMAAKGNEADAKMMHALHLRKGEPLELMQFFLETKQHDLVKGIALEQKNNNIFSLNEWLELNRLLIETGNVELFLELYNQVKILNKDSDANDRKQVMQFLFFLIEKETISQEIIIKWISQNLTLLNQSIYYDGIAEDILSFSLRKDQYWFVEHLLNSHAEEFLPHEFYKVLSIELDKKEINLHLIKSSILALQKKNVSLIEIFEFILDYIDCYQVSSFAFEFIAKNLPIQDMLLKEQQPTSRMNPNHEILEKFVLIAIKKQWVENAKIIAGWLLPSDNIEYYNVLFGIVRSKDAEPNPEIVKLLCQLGVNPFRVNASSFLSFFELAIQNNQDQLVKIYLEVGLSKPLMLEETLKQKRNEVIEHALSVGVKANRPELVKEIFSFLVTEEENEKGWAVIASTIPLDSIRSLIKENVPLHSKKIYILLLERTVKEGYVDVYNEVMAYAKKHKVMLNNEEPNFTDGITKRILKDEKEIHDILDWFEEEKDPIITVPQKNMLLRILTNVRSYPRNLPILKNAILNEDTILIRRLVYVGLNRYFDQDANELLYTAISVKNPEKRVEIFSLLLGRSACFFWGERRREFIELIKTNPKQAYFLAMSANGKENDAKVVEELFLSKGDPLKITQFCLETEQFDFVQWIVRNLENENVTLFESNEWMEFCRILISSGNIDMFLKISHQFRNLYENGYVDCDEEMQFLFFLIEKEEISHELISKLIDMSGIIFSSEIYYKNRSEDILSVALKNNRPLLASSLLAAHSKIFRVDQCYGALFAEFDKKEINLSLIKNGIQVLQEHKVPLEDI
jgi:ankyrin repeat protein